MLSDPCVNDDDETMKPARSKALYSSVVKTPCDIAERSPCVLKYQGTSLERCQLSSLRIIIILNTDPWLGRLIERFPVPASPSPLLIPGNHPALPHHCLDQE